MLSLRNSPPDVAGKVVLIAGAAHGIGGETARLLIQRGALVALLDRDEAAANRLAAELGRNAAAFAADVTVPESIRVAVTAAAQHFGGIDVVVANAGIAGPTATIAAIDAEQFEQVLHINLLGVYRTVAAAIPHLRGDGGYVLIISSIAAVIPGPTVAAYTTSKAGVESFGRALRIELRDKGIAVGIAYFGLIDTGLARSVTEGGLGAVLAAFPKMISEPAPVPTAAIAIADGIARRARRVCAPGWVPLLLDLRPLVIAADRLIGLHPRLRAVIARYSTTDTPRSAAPTAGDRVSKG